MLDPQQLLTEPMWMCLPVRCIKQKETPYLDEFVGLLNESKNSSEKLEKLEQQKQENFASELILFYECHCAANASCINFWMASSVIPVAIANVNVNFNCNIFIFSNSILLT